MWRSMDPGILTSRDIQTPRLPDLWIGCDTSGLHISRVSASGLSLSLCFSLHCVPTVIVALHRLLLRTPFSMSVYDDGSGHSSELLNGMELLEVMTLGPRIRGVQDPGWVQDLDGPKISPGIRSQTLRHDVTLLVSCLFITLSTATHAAYRARLRPYRPTHPVLLSAVS